MVKVGFSKTDLETALRTDDPIREERIEAVGFYAESKDCKGLWMVLDFMDFNKMVTDSLKKSISQSTGLSWEHIHIVTTHNHGGGIPDLKNLSELVAKGAQDAVKAAQPALMRYVFTTVDRQGNILRRLWIPEIDGTATVFYGASEKNDFNSAFFVENVVQKLKEGKLCYSIGDKTERSYVPFQSGDEELVAVQFAGPDGETLGSIVRFAAHAVCCNRDGSFSSDYPFHVRRRMEECLGGIAVFLNGPCGDIAPAMNDKFDGTERVLGEYLANLAVSTLKMLPFEKIDFFKDAKSDILLTVRKEVIEASVEVDACMPENIAERKKYLEKKSMAELMDFLREKYTYGETELSGKITVTFGMVQFGDLILAAFPGETFWSTGSTLQDAFPDKDICTVTEHERTVMYLPPEEEFRRGSYESFCNLTAPDGEKQLREGAIAAMEKFLNKKD